MSETIIVALMSWFEEKIVCLFGLCSVDRSCRHGKLRRGGRNKRKRKEDQNRLVLSKQSFKDDPFNKTPIMLAGP
jgi:hypothetical protein